jgi:hypothetical protein
MFQREDEVLLERLAEVVSSTARSARDRRKLKQPAAS